MNSTNPNRRPTGPGPLVVYGTEPTPAPEHTRVWVEMTAFALLGAAFATAVTLALTGTVEQSPCETALAAADDMAYASAEVGRGLDSAAAGDTVDLDVLRDDWNASYDAYEAARGECGGDR